MSGLRICIFSCNSDYLPGRVSNLSKMWLLLRDTENTTFLDVCMWIFVLGVVCPYIVQTSQHIICQGNSWIVFLGVYDFRNYIYPHI